VNVGPLVNGPGNDRCTAWTPDGKIFLFDSDRAGGFGSKDLWWVYFKNVLGHPLAVDSTLRASAKRF
jgi:WD40-like Beta Propeller Repeat